jgi:serine/threonine-protein kinase
VETRKLGRYEIITELGKGAMGTVYKAVDPLLERAVAIKTINIAADDPEMAEYEARFYQEAKAVGGLNHRNIVTVYDVAKSGNLPYLAMELLDGHELGSLMRKGKPLPVAHALDIAAQVADGLAYAHEHGVVHRDIKPANIMVMKDGLVKIADFGIARMRSRAERNAENVPVLGSPRYMSPEQVLRKRAGAQSDIFSLGVVLYEMLTGSPPFAGADLNSILFQIVNLVPPPPSTIGTMPEMGDFIVAKALAKSPDERYQHAAELAADLRECRKKLDAPAPLSTLEIFKPSVARLDPLAATPLLAQSYPETREGDDDAPEPDPQASTLGLAKQFDSFSATARLAVHTGVADDFDDLVKTQNAASETATVYGTVVRDQSSPRIAPFGPQAERWDPRDRMIFSASVAAAVLLAALIVIL